MEPGKAIKCKYSEETIASWTKPPSDNEETKLANSERLVHEAITADPFWGRKVFSYSGRDPMRTTLMCDSIAISTLTSGLTASSILRFPTGGDVRSSDLTIRPTIHLPNTRPRWRPLSFASSDGRRL